MLYSEDDLPGFTPRSTYTRACQRAALCDLLLVLLFLAILGSTFVHLGTLDTCPMEQVLQP